MIFFIILLLFLMLWKAKLSKIGEFQTEYLSKDNTAAIKGIFVFLIVLSHAAQYMKMSGGFDKSYMLIRSHLGQMVVAMFMFYSGYGMMCQILKKGFSYIKSIPVKRFLVTLVNFDLAVALYFLIGYFVMGKTYRAITIPKALIGYVSVGNSNWYMWCIFALYIMLFLGFLVVGISDKKIWKIVGCIIFTLLTIVFIYWEMKTKLPSRFYNTMILFPFGCWYAMVKDKIDKLVMKNSFTYAATLIIVLVLYVISYRMKDTYGIKSYAVWSVVFTILVLVITMKLTITNPALRWLGNNIFGVYILQRIPMNILEYLGFNQVNRYLFLIVSFAITIVLAIGFNFVTAKIDSWILNIFKSKGEKNE